MRILKDWLKSFDNSEGGFSARKLTAFAGMCTMIYVTVRYTDRDNLVDVMWVLAALVFVMLGIITAGQLIELRTGRTVKEETTTKTTTVTETEKKGQDNNP